MHAGGRVREARARAGWTQAELARRAGLSRAQVSAIETGRSVPSVAAALALAGTVGTSVERLFGARPFEGEPPWAWSPGRAGGRFWLGEVGGTAWRYPVEPTGSGLLPHDGIDGEAGGSREGSVVVERTLVLAGCDPAVGLLADELARDFGVRLLSFVRSSRKALELLRDGRVAVAGVHVGRTSDENLAAARSVAGAEVHLLRLARWEEGIALSPGVGARSAGALRRRSGLRWVGRERGSGAWSCLDELFEGTWEVAAESAPRATGHRDVAEAIRAGWAEAGACVRLAAEEAGLDFVPIRREAYDLCYPAELADDPRLRALRDAVRARRLRRALADLPGYDTRETGTLDAPAHGSPGATRADG